MRMTPNSVSARNKLPTFCLVNVLLTPEYSRNDTQRHLDATGNNKLIIFKNKHLKDKLIHRDGDTSYYYLLTYQQWKFSFYRHKPYRQRAEPLLEIAILNKDGHSEGLLIQTIHITSVTPICWPQFAGEFLHSVEASGRLAVLLATSYEI